MTTDERLQAIHPEPGPGGGVTESAEAAAAAVAVAGAVEPPPPPPGISTPGAPSSQAIADWPAPPAGSPGGIPEAGSTVGLWPAGGSAAASFFLGFPAGLALVAGAWYRLGRRGLAVVHLAVVVALVVLTMLLPEQLSGLRLVTHLAVAVYTYTALGRAHDVAARSGVASKPGGVASGLAIMVGGWALAIAASLVLGTMLVLLGWDEILADPADEAATSPAAVTRSVEPVPAPTGPGSIGGATGTFGMPDLDACPTTLGEMHQAPGVEALLPARVGGRDLSIWSVRGWCWLHLTTGDVGTAQVAPMIQDEGIDVESLQYAVAGRADVDADPPYFVFAASRPADPDARDVALSLLLGGTGYDRWPFDLSAFEPREVGDRVAFVGTPDMVTQSEHQRGRPWLYQTADTMFVIITDDDAWAEEAIGQLPCCWSND